MQSLFFHPLFAWSLVDDLWTSRVLPENFLYGGFQERLNSLRGRGLVSDTVRSSARQMFVFAENVILPPDMDISRLMDTELYQSGAITWGNEQQRRALKFTEPSVSNLSADRAAELAPFIEDPDIDPSDVKYVIDFWNRSREFEILAREELNGEANFMALQVMGLRDDIANGVHENNPFWSRFSPAEQSKILEIFKNDPEPEKASLEDLIRTTRAAYFFSSAMTRLADMGVPTLAMPRPGAFGQKPQIDHQDDLGLEYLVNLYFDNVVVPAPDTAIEALRFRDSGRIDQWRGKIRAWQQNLASGRATEAEVLEELADANGYLKGARFIRTTVGRISPWVTGGLAIATYFVETLPFHAEITAALITHTVLERAGAAIEASVYGSHPLKAEWLMLPPVEQHQFRA